MLVYSFHCSFCVAEFWHNGFLSFFYAFLWMCKKAQGISFKRKQNQFILLYLVLYHSNETPLWLSKHDCEVYFSMFYLTSFFFFLLFSVAVDLFSLISLFFSFLFFLFLHFPHSKTLPGLRHGTDRALI